MIQSLLPDGVAAEETFGDGDVADLWPEEERAVAGAVEKRRREFATARGCARRGLRRLGIAPAPILPGPDREPRWPDGVVGSLTHCAGYAAAAAALRTTHASLGIDAEAHDVLPDGVLALVALDDERAWIDEHQGTGIHYDRLLFSAKESVFKAWFALAREWLDFSEARVEIDRAASAFRATLLRPGPTVDGRPLTHFDGRFLVADGLVLTAVAVAAREPHGPGG